MKITTFDSAQGQVVFHQMLFPCVRWVRWGILFSVLALSTITFSPVDATNSNGDDRAVKTALVVCLDAGHPSEVNSGRSKQNGVTELDMNWIVANQLARALRDRHIRVVMTKQTKDQVVSNRRRAEIANAARATLFLRLHCDTEEIPRHGSPKKSGFTVYYPDLRGNADGKKGPSSAVVLASKHAAGTMHTGMERVLAPVLRDNGVKGDSATAIGGKQVALTGSVFSQVAVLTVEMVFLSNPQDVKFISSSKGQTQMVQALTDGVLESLHLH